MRLAEGSCNRAEVSVSTFVFNRCLLQCPSRHIVGEGNETQHGVWGIFVSLVALEHPFDGPLMLRNRECMQTPKNLPMGRGTGSEVHQNLCPPWPGRISRWYVGGWGVIGTLVSAECSEA